MIIFDANVLITLTAYDESNSDCLKITSLISRLCESKITVGIPAPALSEFMVRTDDATSEVIESLRKKPYLKILPFDEASATEAAIILKTAMNDKGHKRGDSQSSWQKVKFDRQILAIAKTNRATEIYSDDENLIKEALRIGLVTKKVSELPMPQVQTTIKFD